MSGEMSVLLAHTMTAPHVQQPARALYEAGLLSRYITGVRDRPDAFSQRTLCTVARLVGFDLAAQLRKRVVTEVPSALVEDHPWGELLRLLSSRLDRSGRLTDRVWERTETAFDRLVARRLNPKIHQAVYGFEYTARHTFERARKLGLKCIYDVPAPEPRFVQDLIEREVARFPELRTPFFLHSAAREPARIAYRRHEWNDAGLVIAASNFTRDSFARAGLDVSKVRVVPYGAPPCAPAEEARTGGSAGRGPIRFLWAGTFSIRKGAHYLLEAWRAANLGAHAQLDVFGSQGLPARLVTPSPVGVVFHAPVSRAELMAWYQRADILLFPTLCDGFGMVATEAWSRGLPVLTTSNAGAADFLKPNENGLLVPPGDTTALATALTWCVEHRNELQAMRPAAHSTAANWQWHDYRAALGGAVKTFLASRS